MLKTFLPGGRAFLHCRSVRYYAMNAVVAKNTVFQFEGHYNIAAGEVTGILKKSVK